MAFQANIPQPTDRKSKSQDDMLGNFQALAPFGNGYADFAPQGAAPVFPAGDDGIYAKALSGVSELYVHKQSNNAPTEVPFTASKMSATAIAACTSGWSYLPSGLLVKWGSAPTATNGLLAITVAAESGGPAFNQTFQAFISPKFVTTPSVGFTAYISSNTLHATTGDFSVQTANTSINTSITYLVIGV